MADYFNAAVHIVLEEENVFSDSANDPGGQTKWGIARNRHPEIPDADWAAYTKDDAIALYRKGYWDANRCGEMPWPWALCVFDGEVNQGSVIAVAQHALGLPRVDGVIGPATLAAMQTATDEHLAMFLALRVKSYIALPKFPYDGVGWVKRTFNVALRAHVVPTA
jgi:lysozyme family protein